MWHKPASREGYEGKVPSEAAEWLSAKAKGFDMSYAARRQRARDMGYITDLDAAIGDSDGLGRGRTAETVPNQRGRDGSGIVSQEAARDRNIRGQGRSQEDDPQTFYHGTVDDISAFEFNHPYQKDMGWIGAGIYVSTDATMDNTTTGNGESNLMPVMVRASCLYKASRFEVKNYLSFVSLEKIHPFT